MANRSGFRVIDSNAGQGSAAPDAGPTDET